MALIFCQTSCDFAFLMSMIGHKIGKPGTNYRKSIPVNQKLTVASLTTICSLFVPEVFGALIDLLKENIQRFFQKDLEHFVLFNCYSCRRMTPSNNQELSRKRDCFIYSRLTVKWNEGAGVNRRSPRKPTYQRFHPAHDFHVRKSGSTRRESNPVHLGKFRGALAVIPWCSRLVRRRFWGAGGSGFESKQYADSFRGAAGSVVTSHLWVVRDRFPVMILGVSQVLGGLAHRRTTKRWLPGVDNFTSRELLRTAMLLLRNGCKRSAEVVVSDVTTAVLLPLLLALLVRMCAASGGTYDLENGSTGKGLGLGTSGLAAIFADNTRENIPRFPDFPTKKIRLFIMPVAAILDPNLLLLQSTSGVFFFVCSHKRFFHPSESTSVTLLHSIPTADNFDSSSL
ncbi:hypothetical protein PR048_028603 [Dryococelus australis]|uniref:Uncharacterized protein n=1 Tax=Dryococelus australis TaxID=614101 RepID=A0ABQ9GEW8_9NEOP|nr:hypothetical protein PR048_028603 [Dryococelus australis]